MKAKRDDILKLNIEIKKPNFKKIKEGISEKKEDTKVLLWKGLNKVSDADRKLKEKTKPKLEKVARHLSKKNENVKVKKKHPIKKLVRKTAAIGISGAVALAILVPMGLNAISHQEKISALNETQAPISMDLTDYDDGMVIEEDSESEMEEEKKIGFFKRIKLAIYGFFGAIGLWVATKIPWKKIFNKRNLIILLILIIVGLLVYYFTPMFWENCPWDNNGHIRIIIKK